MSGIRSLFEESVNVKRQIIESDAFIVLEKMGDIIVDCVKQGNKIMLCGNGGSAADAQHLAAEMLIRLRSTHNREGIPAIALAQDTSTITACANDYNYEKLYERMIQSLGKTNDVLIGISTSGNSKNIICAMNMARSMGVRVFGFLGSDGGGALDLCEDAFVVPSNNTGRIQEAHITAGHALMEYVEDQLLETNYLHLQD